MKKLTNKKRFSLGSSKCFTLIEVVLVLAIGGLIFLLAFIAFQQVSANRRDTQRRADAGRVIAELQNYYTDQGKYLNPSEGEDVTAGNPGTSDSSKFLNNYMGGANFKSPDGSPYRMIYNSGVSDSASVQQFSTLVGVQGKLIFYGKNKVCQGSSFLPGGNNDVAIMMTLEKGVVCRDTRAS